MRRYGYTWGDLQRLAQNRDDWRVLIGGLCSRRGYGNDDDDDIFRAFSAIFRMFRDFWLNLKRPSDKAEFTGRFGSGKKVIVLEQ